MKRMLTHFLVVGVPGLCFVIAGVLTDEYPAAALGAVLLIGSVYGLVQKRVVSVGDSEQKRQRRSFVLAGIIGASFATTGVAGHRYVLAAAGTVILIGALLRLYGRALAKE
jgi:hypothetical protein